MRKFMKGCAITCLLYTSPSPRDKSGSLGNGSTHFSPGEILSAVTLGRISEEKVDDWSDGVTEQIRENMGDVHYDLEDKVDYDSDYEVKSGKIEVYVLVDASQGIEAQTQRALENISAILAEAGYALSDVVKTTVLLQDIGDFAAMNGVYATYFTGALPARVCYEVARLLRGGASADGCARRDRRRGGEVAGAFLGRGPHAETGAAGFRRPINASHVCGAHLLHLL